MDNQFKKIQNTKYSITMKSHVLSFLITSLCLMEPGFSQSNENQATLQPTNQLGKSTSPLVFASGQRVQGTVDQSVQIDGDAQLRRNGSVLEADHIAYNPNTEQANASGNVRIDNMNNVYEGDVLDLNVQTFAGSLTKPTYQFSKTQGAGKADRIDFTDSTHAILTNGNYSTCKADGTPDWIPDWMIQAGRLHIDNKSNTARAEDGQLNFKGVVIPLPPVRFPLNGERLSGWLPPNYSSDSVSGIGLSIPYYWNIAPNMDATLVPTYNSKRGMNWGGEFRYLQPNYSGEAALNFMHNDPLRQKNRWGLVAQHRQKINAGKIGVLDLQNLSLTMSLNRVGDNDYWRDFPKNNNTTNTTLAQRILNNELALSGGQSSVNSNWAWQIKTNQWQTLQDASSLIVPSYNKLPQLNVTHQTTLKNPWLKGIEVKNQWETTRFASDSKLTNQPNALRAVWQTQVSRPVVNSGWFFTPKAQLHASHYDLDSPINANQTEPITSINRFVPTLSVDAGLNLERDAHFFGIDTTEVLEPRLFYTYTPYRNQNFIPVYDTAALDLNLATMFVENPFSGNDRIADNHSLTLGVTSRFLNPDTGAEWLRFMAGQRLRLTSQEVTLPNTPPLLKHHQLSDLLLGASVHISPKWSAETSQQYNTDTARLLRSTVELRYNPERFHSINLAYRMQREISEQIETSWQWRLNGTSASAGNWYTVGRLNYSTKDKKLVDSLVGLEYDSGCWLGRMVLEKTTRGDATSNKRIMFQLELLGLARLGQTGALASLRNSVAGYQTVHENIR